MTGQILTSWKEIAAYFGKGVRTVQRWEAEMGLPVRRPGPERHIVVAFPDELDNWVRNTRRNPMPREPQRLAQPPRNAEEHRKELHRLRLLLGTMVERLHANRDHTSRLVAQVSRYGIKTTQNSKN